MEIHPLALKEDGVIVSGIKRLRIDLKKFKFLIGQVDGRVDRAAVGNKKSRLFIIGKVFKKQSLSVALTLELYCLGSYLLRIYQGKDAVHSYSFLLLWWRGS